MENYKTVENINFKTLSSFMMGTLKSGWDQSSRNIRNSKMKTLHIKERF